MLGVDIYDCRLGYAEPTTIRQMLADCWFRICYHNPDFSVDSYQTYQLGESAQNYPLTMKLRGKFWLKNKVLRHF